MARYGNVNINYTLSGLREFPTSVDKAQNSMADIYNSLQSSHEKAKKMLDDCSKAVVGYLESCEKEQRKADGELPQMRNEHYRLNSIAEKLQAELSAAVDARSKLNKEMSPDEYNDADSAVETAHATLENCKTAISTVEKCITNLERAIGELERQHRELEKQKSKFESARSQLESAWNSFSSGYDSVESELSRVKNSAKKAYDAAYTVCEDIALLKGSSVNQDEKIAFRSIEAVADCASDIKISAEQIMRKFSDGLNFNSYYADQISDPVIQEIIKTNEDIGQSFRSMGEKYGQVAERLDMLAESLTDYIKCKL